MFRTIKAKMAKMTAQARAEHLEYLRERFREILRNQFDLTVNHFINEGIIVQLGPVRYGDNIRIKFVTDLPASNNDWSNALHDCISLHKFFEEYSEKYYTFSKDETVQHYKSYLSSEDIQKEWKHETV